ncbi:MAG: septal ring lytic transglycosylase RlpA family protein [Hyphomicrobium sp.]
MVFSLRRLAITRDAMGISASAVAAALLTIALVAAPAEAKTPGKTYCFNGICHRVLSIPEMVAIVGHDETLEASHYDDCRRDRFNPCGLTSSGEAFRPNEADSAASPIYPDGTVLLIRNPANGSTAVVRVNNAGPYWRKRKLDVSRAAAERLGFAERGVATLEVRVMSAPSIVDATYKKNRRYAPVPGPIGEFASLDQAQGGMMIAMAFDAMSTSIFAPVSGKMLQAMKTMAPALANVLRTDATRVATADNAMPSTVVASIEKSLSVAEAPKAKDVASPVARSGKRVGRATTYTLRRSAVRTSRFAKSRSHVRWAAVGHRRQFRGTRSITSSSNRRVFAVAGSSSTKRSYWTSRASRKAAAISSRGPRAMRLATRKLSSMVRSDARRTSAASGAIRPRLRT